MKPTHIIIHSSATADSDSLSWGVIRANHKRLGWSDIGYHYGIELARGHFEMLIGRMADREGSHCRAGGMNGKSLGICMVGNFDNVPPREVAVDKLVNLVRYLMFIHGIPKANVRRHADYESKKTCPGLAFPWAEFKARLGQFDQMAKSHK